MHNLLFLFSPFINRIFATVNNIEFAERYFKTICAIGISVIAGASVPPTAPNLFLSASKKAHLLNSSAACKC